MLIVIFYFRTPTQILSPDATPTHSRLNTPCFSPPPLRETDSGCSTPTMINPAPPHCYSPTGLPPPAPPAYIHPPPYRQSNTLPSPALNNIANLRSSLRQSPAGSLPRSSTNSNGTSIYSEKSNSPHPQRRVNFQDMPLPPLIPASPKKSTKKISFNLIPQEAPALPKKPTPPMRSDSTRLTSPKKLSNSNSAPPTDFLKDLQRVMRKKWQVAQKCKAEPTTTPHEVLGFRDPPPAIADYRETNVSNWVQEHYGQNNLYENIYRTGSSDEKVVEYATSPVHMANSEQIKSKRPPPPPPKRSETTHLTSAPKLH